MNLTANEQLILKIIFRYRGSIQMYITQFFYRKSDVTYSNEKYIYGVLSKLRKKKLVTYKTVRYFEKELFLYYLTPQGLELTKGLLKIGVAAHGTGILPHNDRTIYWDIPFQFYKPPTQQIKHFLLTQEAYLQLETKRELMEAYDVTYKTSHYASITFTHKGEQTKLRPDSLIYIENKPLALEVDCRTEWSKQLTEKFQRYKHYFDYCSERHLPLPFESILFVMQSGLSKRAYEQRWMSIRSAFKEAFGESYSGVDLKLYPIDAIKDLPMQYEIEAYYKKLNERKNTEVEVTIL